MSLPLADADVLPNHPKLIRDAIKKILKAEVLLESVTEWYNTLIPEATRQPPYGYILFRSRTPDKTGHDINSFRYGVLFQVGIVVKLLTRKEDDLDDLALNLINLVDSSLTKNGRILNTVDLDYTEKPITNQDLGFLPEHRHLAMNVVYYNYTSNNI